MRLGFFLREALRALKRNAVPSFAAMATVLVTVLVLGVFIPVVQATTGAANEVRGKRDRRRLPEDRTPSRPTSTACARLHRDRTPHVEQRRSSSPRSRPTPTERKRNPEAYELLGSNPLPDTFRVTPDKPDDIAKIRDALAPLAPRGGRTVDRPRDRRGPQPRGGHEQDPLGHARREAHDGAAARCCSCVASMLLIANTIRLSLYARRREVEVMKLVGATDWFIRWPFVLEGVLVGALGGLLAVLLLGVVKIALVDPLAADFALIAAPDTIELPAADRRAARRRRSRVSALGSGLSLRRFLRV